MLLFDTGGAHITIISISKIIYLIKLNHVINYSPIHELALFLNCSLPIIGEAISLRGGGGINRSSPARATIQASAAVLRGSESNKVLSSIKLKVHRALI